MGLTKPRAAQIYNLDYKQATRVITTTDITLSGGAPNSVDGVNLALNDRVLVIGQSTGSQNGIYKVTSLGAGSNGTWTRTTDADATGEIEAGMIIMVTEGNIYADTQWKLTTNDPIVIGTTSLTFVINILSSVGGSNTQVQFNDGGTLAGSSALTFDKSTNILSVNGNISGNYYIGNGSQLTGISSSGGSSISNGTSNVNVVSSGGNVTVGVGGTPDVAVFATTGGYINGVLSVSGNITSAANITGGNLLTGGLISVSGTVTSSSLLGSVISASANITGGNVLTGGIISATGDVTGGNVLTVGLISATSTVTGSSLLGSVVSATANITGGNLLTGGLISATANITGGNLNASGLSLTGTVSSNLIPIANITYSLGNSTNRWKDLFLSGNTIILGDANLSTSGSDFSVSGNISSPANIYGANIIASANIDSGNANITTQINTTSVSASGNIRTAGTVSSTGTVTSSSLLGTVVSASANITGGNVLTGGLISATGNTTAAALITTNNNTGFNVRLGDDAWIGDRNITNGFAITGINDSTAGYIQFGSDTTLLGRTGTGALTWGSQFSTTGNVTVPALITTNNNTGFNVKIGDDVWLGDVNVGDTMSIRGVSTPTNGYIIFGSSNETALGRSGTGPLTYGGAFSASANITGGNVLTGGLMSATSTITSAANVTGGNLLTGGLISATGNITGGNINTGGLISATSTITSAANIAGGNLLTVGLVSASGTITGTSHIGSVVSVTANVTGGNVLTSGLVSATGNISANYFIGNGSLLTGISGGGSYSNANVAAYLPTYPGNLVSLTGPVTTTGNITGDYIYGNGYYLTGISGGTNIAPLAGTVDNFTGNGVQTNFTLSTTPTSVNLIFVNVNGVYQLPTAYSLSTNVLTMTSAVPNGAVLSVTQLSGGGIANSLVNGSSNIVVAANSNISMSAAGTANVAVVASNGLYLTGTITVNTGNAATAIINGAANGVGNIGSSSTYFDTVFAKATSAQYADLAEMYVSDFGYVPGTVVVFGGEQEVTLATTTDDHRVAGVVSTNPSYLMNSIQQGEYVIPVALTGRVPCKVTGTIRKGDLMVTAGNGHAYANNRAQSGTIIGKALENHSGESGVIEVVVGTR